MSTSPTMTNHEWSQQMSSKTVIRRGGKIRKKGMTSIRNDIPSSPLDAILLEQMKNPLSVEKRKQQIDAALRRDRKKLRRTIKQILRDEARAKSGKEKIVPGITTRKPDGVLLWRPKDV